MYLVFKYLLFILFENMFVNFIVNKLIKANINKLGVDPSFPAIPLHETCSLFGLRSLRIQLFLSSS